MSLVNLVVGDAVFSCYAVGYIYIYKLLVSYLPYNLIETEFGQTDFSLKNCFKKKNSVVFKPKCDFVSILTHPATKIWDGGVTLTSACLSRLHF